MTRANRLVLVQKGRGAAMKVLMLCTNPRFEPSMRFRLLQFLEPLKAAGHEVTLSTFLHEKPRGLAGHVVPIIRGFGHRLADLVRARQVDRIVVHREILPMAFNHYVRLLPKHVELIFDFDDAVFLHTSSTGWRARIARPESTRLLVERAAVTYAGNEYLADYARRFSSNVRIVPTVLDTDRFAPITKPARARPLVGWVGSASTSKYLELVMPALEQVAKHTPFTLRLVGAGRDFSVNNVEVDNRAWREDEEVRAFQELDVGLYPLIDDAWSRGKCGFKAIQYMACGVPFAVSPVGVIRDMVRDGVDGLWAQSPSQWVDHLTALLTDEPLRARLVASARERAVAKYSVKAIAGGWIRGIEHPDGG